MIDTREVHLFYSRKSIGSERTLHEDLDDVGEIVEVLEGIAERLTDRMKRYNIAGRTITLKIKYYNFKRISRSLTCKEPVKDRKIIMENVLRLIPKTDLGKRKVRLVGVSISKLADQADMGYKQLTLPLED